MPRYRMIPLPAQEVVLRDHCAHARYVWNLAVEQHAHWRPGRARAPGYLEQCRQLTAARFEYDWLRAGSQTVQQQALRDFNQATAAFLTLGTRVSAALSTGDRLYVPGLTWREQARLRRLERKLARAKRGSGRRKKVKLAIARGRARETDRRKDWVEKKTTDIVQRFDLIKVEDLRITNMTRSAKGTGEKPGRNVRQKAGLNRGILRSGWGLVDAKSRKSQARFVCTACGYACHADVNAARNIAAGHVVTARGGFRGAGPANREPQLLASLTG